MKICSRCKTEKLEFQFHKNKNSKSGLTSDCKDCHNEAHRNNYKHNAKRREYVYKYNKTRYEERKQIVKGYLSKHPCVDCGNTDIRVLEFDHIRGEKKFNIGRTLTVGTMKILEEEIAKCEVRCANCHKIRHYNEK